jgi:hypothetical protein
VTAAALAIRAGCSVAEAFSTDTGLLARSETAVGAIAVWRVGVGLLAATSSAAVPDDDVDVAVDAGEPVVVVFAVSPFVSVGFVMRTVDADSCMVGASGFRALTDAGPDEIAAAGDPATTDGESVSAAPADDRDAAPEDGEPASSLADGEPLDDDPSEDPVSAAAIPCPVAIEAPKPTATTPAPSQCVDTGFIRPGLRCLSLPRRTPGFVVAAIVVSPHR